MFESFDRSSLEFDSSWLEILEELIIANRASDHSDDGTPYKYQEATSNE